MYLLLWLTLFMLVFLIPLVLFSTRWGAPWPYAYRQRRMRRDDDDRDVVQLEDSAHDQTTDDPWWYWADILWFVFVVMLVWAVVALIF